MAGAGGGSYGGGFCAAACRLLPQLVQKAAPGLTGLPQAEQKLPPVAEPQLPQNLSPGRTGEPHLVQFMSYLKAGVKVRYFFLFKHHDTIFPYFHK
jgi:hypothetical protein